MRKFSKIPKKFRERSILCFVGEMCAVPYPYPSGDINLKIC